MKRQSPASPSKRKPPEKQSHATTRILSSNLDLKKSGLLSRTSSPRVDGILPSPSRSRAQNSPSITDQRQAEVHKRLQEQEEARRNKMLQKINQDKERLIQIEKRREEIKAMMRKRGKDRDQKMKEHHRNIIHTNQSKYDNMLNKLNQRESRRLQVISDAQQAEKEAADRKALENVVSNIDKRRNMSRERERELAASKLKRRKDAELRHRATKALWDRQAAILAAIRARNRAELERLLSVRQPQLEARMPKYNFMEYPANRNMKRLLFEYQRKRIDEVTFNKEAERLALRMSPRRILLHQNQLLREELTMKRQMDNAASSTSLVHISKEPTSKRTHMTWKKSALESDKVKQLAASLADEALEHGGVLFTKLLERSDVDLSALIEGPTGQTFDDTGDIDQTLSAFDFGDELNVDEEAVERIDHMYKSQACKVSSDRKTRAYPSGELETFSSAVLEVGMGCSCTTLSGIDSQCSLCQQGVKEKAEKEHKKKTSRVLKGLKKLF